MSISLQQKVQTILLTKTQKEAAKQLGVSERTIRRWKNGELKTKPRKSNNTRLNRTIGGLKSSGKIKNNTQKIRNQNKSKTNKQLNDILKYNRNIKERKNKIVVSVLYELRPDSKQAIGSEVLNSERFLIENKRDIEMLLAQVNKRKILQINVNYPENFEKKPTSKRIKKNAKKSTSKKKKD